MPISKNNRWKQKYIIIVNTYRSPNDLQATTDDREFVDEFGTLLTSLDKSNSGIIITGDFNINLLKLNKKAIYDKFYDILTTNSFLPKITTPTLFTN